jgi:hypothetical protein
MTGDWPLGRFVDRRTTQLTAESPATGHLDRWAHQVRVRAHGRQAVPAGRAAGPGREPPPRSGVPNGPRATLPAGLATARLNRY